MLKTVTKIKSLKYFLPWVILVCWRIISEIHKEYLEAGADIIDINMGCPMRKITKTGRGAAMMKDIVKTSKLKLILTEV